MRWVLVVVPVVVVAAIVAGPLGASGSSSVPPDAARVAHSRPTAPFPRLSATFRRLIPSATCGEAANLVDAARRTRTDAVRGARTAPPTVLRRKKAAMRRAIALLKRAGALCAAGPPPAGGSGAPPAPSPTPTLAPSPNPPNAAAQTLTLHVAPGDNLRYTETSAMVAAGALRLEMQNASDLEHFVAVRNGAGISLGESKLADTGETVFVVLTLPAGDYEVFCRSNGHDEAGMVMPLVVR